MPFTFSHMQVFSLIGTAVNRIYLTHRVQFVVPSIQRLLLDLHPGVVVAIQNNTTQLHDIHFKRFCLARHAIALYRQGWDIELVIAWPLGYIQYSSCIKCISPAAPSCIHCPLVASFTISWSGIGSNNHYRYEILEMICKHMQSLDQSHVDCSSYSRRHCASTLW